MPKAAGQLLVGATAEPPAGFDRRVTLEAMVWLGTAAANLCPSLGRAKPVESWADLRPCTLNGLPVLGQLPDRPDVWVAASPGRSGILLAPLIARMMAHAILEGRSLPHACAPMRFTVGEGSGGGRV